jgi:hypothetical protein
MQDKNNNFSCIPREKADGLTDQHKTATNPVRFFAAELI